MKALGEWNVYPKVKPLKEEEYLVTIDGKYENVVYEHAIESAYWEEGQFWIHGIDMPDVTVLAWMEYPKPYGEQDLTLEEFCSKENRIRDMINANNSSDLVYNGHADFNPAAKNKRAELKRQKRSNETLTLTRKALEDYGEQCIKKAHEEMLMSTARLISLLWCVRLHDMDGMGGKRLRERAYAVSELMDCISMDYVEWEDLRDTLAKETKFYMNLGGKE